MSKNSYMNNLSAEFRTLQKTARLPDLQIIEIMVRACFLYLSNVTYSLFTLIMLFVHISYNLLPPPTLMLYLLFLFRVGFLSYLIYLSTLITPITRSWLTVNPQ